MFNCNRKDTPRWDADVGVDARWDEENKQAEK